MEKDFGAGFAIGLILGVVGILATGFLVELRMERMAVDSGIGRYVTDKYGSVKFEFIKPAEAGK